MAFRHLGRRFACHDVAQHKIVFRGINGMDRRCRGACSDRAIDLNENAGLIRKGNSMPRLRLTPEERSRKEQQERQAASDARVDYYLRTGELPDRQGPHGGAAPPKAA
jgi:hypothetical protein